MGGIRRICQQKTKEPRRRAGAPRRPRFSGDAGRGEIDRLDGELAFEARGVDPAPSLAGGSERQEEHHPRDPERGRGGGGSALRGRSVPDVRAVRGDAGLEDRDPAVEREHDRRLQGGHRAHREGEGRVLAAALLRGRATACSSVPATETQGRIRTSTATVAPSAGGADDVEVSIEEKDLEISASRRAVGQGGRGSTRPTAPSRSCASQAGVDREECRDETGRSSRTRPKARAQGLERAALLDIEREKQEAAQSAERRSMVSTGERGARRSGRANCSAELGEPITASGSHSINSTASSKGTS